MNIGGSMLNNPNLALNEQDIETSEDVFFDAQEEFDDQDLNSQDFNSEDEEEFFDAQDEFPEVREARAKTLAAVMPILVMNQMGPIFNLQKMVKSSVENGDSNAAKKVLENIFKIEISPVKLMFQMAMMGNLSNELGAQEFEAAIRLGLVTQYQMYLPQLIKELFDAKLISNEELVKLAESEAGADIVSYIKALALDETQEIDYSELALVLAIKQKDWDFVMRFQLLEDQLADHEELLSDIYTASRLDVLEYCKESKVFGIDERIYEDINAQDSDGRTLLMEAAAIGDVAEVKRLLALGANPALKDADGYSALMHAVSYTGEELAQINIANSKRSDEIKKLMASKAEVVKTLIADKRVKVTETNVLSMDAFEIAIFQGLVTTEAGLTELRGDHAIMDALLSGGANPIFGDFEWSFKFKSALTLALSIFSTGLKNRLEATPIGMALTTLCPPISWALNSACDAVVAYKSYYDAKNIFYRLIKTALSSEYANDAFFSLEKKPLIGAYYINWLGKVYTGEKLKNFMVHHVGYDNVSKGYFSEEDLPKDANGALRMNSKDKLALSNEIANRYEVIQQELNRFFMMPWTRKALKKVAKDLKHAYDFSQTGYKLSDDIVRLIDSVAKVKNHANVVAEINSNSHNAELFYQVLSAMRSGALAVSLETRHNIESLALKIQNPKLLKESFWQKIAAYFKDSDKPDVAFADLVKVCDKYSVEGINFGMLLQAMQAEFTKDLNSNRDLRTINERIHDGAVSLFHKIVEGVAGGIAYLANTDKDKVLEATAEAAARSGATVNAIAHTAVRRWYDSKYFIPASIVAGFAFLAVKKFPDKIWIACKYMGSALMAVACATVAAVGMLMKCISRAYEYVKPKEVSTAIDLVMQQEQQANKPVVNISPDIIIASFVMIPRDDGNCKGSATRAA
jgi:hypothetical protein